MNTSLLKNTSSINNLSFTKTVCEGATPLYKKVIQHPFIVELSNGTLGTNRFINYIQQDALYLVDYAKVLSVIAAKSTCPKIIQQFLEFSKDAIKAERSLHEDYLKQFNVKPVSNKNLVCFAYTQFLLSAAYQYSVEEAIAAIAPCFWVYREVGNFIFNNHASINNPYKVWIDTYASPEFSTSTDIVLDIMNDLANAASPKHQKSMERCFNQSTFLEYHFWDSCYQLSENSF